MEKTIWDKLNLLARYGKLSPRERRVFAWAAGCFFVLLSDLTVVRPLWNFYISLEERIAAEERTLVRNLVNLKKKETVESEYEKYRPFLRPTGSNEEETAGLLSEVEQLARSHQVVLVDMRPQEAKTLQFHKEYTTELDAEGEMANLVQFMSQMEESTQLLKVSSAKVSSKEAKSPIVKARMVVTKTVLLGKF